MLVATYDGCYVGHEDDAGMDVLAYKPGAVTDVLPPNGGKPT